MRMVRKSQIWRAIPVLIAVCLVSLSVHSSQQRCCGGWPQAQYVGGTGEPDNPYLIFTGKQMNDVCTEPDNWDKHFRLMADIDLEGYSYDTALIAPEKNTDDSDLNGIPFTGVFDGDGHTITNLEISGKGYLGLFGRLEAGAEIRNLCVVNVNIIGSDNNIGGLVGYNGGTVTNCYSTGSVGGNSNIGGLVGNNSGGVVVNSYSTALAGGINAVGGLVGDNSDGVVIHCYSTGAVGGSANVGGLMGANIDGSVTGCFWDIETSGLALSSGGTGLTTAEMQTAAAFLRADWDFMGEIDNGSEDLWWILEGQDYPRLWWEPVKDDDSDGIVKEILFADDYLMSAELTIASDSDTTEVNDYFAEEFSSSLDVFDLSNRSIMFTPTTDSSFYSPVMSEITQLPTDPIGGTPLTLDDDSSEYVYLRDQKSVLIFGSSYRDFYVGSNGYITFGREDTRHMYSLRRHFDTRRISVLFDDFDPSKGGVVNWKQLTDRVVVTWDSIPKFAKDIVFTFQVEMYFDGRIRLAWLEIANGRGIVGLSTGRGIPDDFQETDFSKYPISDGGTDPGDDPGGGVSSGRKNRKR